MNYNEYLQGKSQLSGNFGFTPLFVPDFLFPFQKFAVEWLVKKGRGELMFDCGLGKCAMMLVWAQNIVQKTNGRVLILCPLGVAKQTEKEAAKFGIEAELSRDGKFSASAKIVITNYQQLRKFNSSDFKGAACDEASIMKNFDGQIKEEITEFMRLLQYRSLYTATAAPNDYIELGTSSECLGELGYMDMLGRFFKNAQNSLHPSVYRRRGQNSALKDEGAKFRFRGHAERDFWRWVCSWARAARKPSDLGFSDEGYILPKLTTVEHSVKASTLRDGYLIDLPAVGLAEQRAERSRTLQERCELAASLVNGTGKPAVAWCHLCAEGNLLEKLIPDAIQIDGNDTDEFKEEALEGFQTGKIRVLITKPSLTGYGLNWQFCNHQTFFPSHSFEQYYQAVRRCWRFGQKNPVRVDMITSEGESGVLKNMNRKAAAAEQMFTRLVELVNQELKIEQINNHTKEITKPSWL